MTDDDDTGFLSRWSRRKALVREGQPVAPAVAPPGEPATPAPPRHAHAALPTTAAVPGARGAAAAEVTGASGTGAGPAASPPADTDAAPPPAPTLEEAQALTPDADFRRFVRPDVSPQVRNAALRQLFADPRYNVMDGLDIYIDDYGRPDPLPAGMLRKMTQSAFLNLFADEPEAATGPAGATAPAALPAAPTAPATPAAPAANALPETAPDEDPDLRLQPHDAAGPPGPGPGPGQDPGRER